MTIAVDFGHKATKQTNKQTKSILEKLCFGGYFLLHFNISRINTVSESFKARKTVKPVLSGHSKIDKIKVLKTDSCLVQVKSAFCNTFDLH